MCISTSYRLVLESNSLQRGASLSTELPSTVCGVDHLPGVTLGPGWEHKNTRERLQGVFLLGRMCVFVRGAVNLPSIPTAK